MKFKVILKCRGCHNFTKHIVRTKLNAGIVIQLQIACQVCGDHEVNWYSKEVYQNLFINKIEREDEKK